MNDLVPPLSDSAEVPQDLEVWKAITLTQPWATLVVLGAKLWETRSKPTRYRGWLAIHAAKSFPRDALRLCSDQPFRAALARGGYQRPEYLPVARVVGLVRLVDCQRTEIARIGLKDIERAFGDYSDGRWAYRMIGARRLVTEVPARGFQSIPWTLEAPIRAGAVP